jgi:hypothetical protein
VRTDHAPAPHNHSHHDQVCMCSITKSPPALY